MIQLTLQEMHDKGGNFESKFGQALKDGFFYIEVPKDLRKHTAGVKQVAGTLRDNALLKAAELGPRLGYQERHGCQAVAFSAMSHQWGQVFDDEVAVMARTMNEMALDILKMTLQHLSIPENIWSEATGKLTDGEGSNVFTFNHYQPVEGEQRIGLIPHKDMGWITVLFIDKTGLQTSLDGKNWTDVGPQENYFVVNFGRAFELLVDSTDKLKASLHRVCQLAEERISFGVFINHTEGASMYQLDNQGALVKKGSYEQYLNLCFSEFAALQNQLNDKDNFPNA